MMELTCIICPRGCQLQIDCDGNVSGNMCKRGVAYAISEVTNPTRTLTTTVKIINSEINRLPVKTSKPIPKSYIFKVMGEINKKEVIAPIKINDIIIKNILVLDVDIVATRSLEEKNEHMA